MAPMIGTGEAEVHRRTQFVLALGHGCSGAAWAMRFALRTTLEGDALARSKRFIFCRTARGSSIAPFSPCRHPERARQNPKHPTGSHPDQQSLFSSMT